MSVQGPRRGPESLPAVETVTNGPPLARDGIHPGGTGAGSTIYGCPARSGIRGLSFDDPTPAMRPSPT